MQKLQRNMQKRLHSKALWVAMLSLVLFLLKTYLNYEIEQGDKLLELILIVLTALGIVNNPTERNRL